MVFLAIFLVGAVWVGIWCMIYGGICTALKDDDRKKRFWYTMYAKKLANKLYREQMQQTEYRVNVPIVIHNDSDIKW